MKRIAIATLGCKVNQIESSSILEQFLDMGFTAMEFSESADVYLINTCTVTNRTDFKSRNLIRQALQHKADNPLVLVIVTGCYSQKEKKEIEALGEIDLIVDNQNKIEVSDWFQNRRYKYADVMQAGEMRWHNISQMHGRSRAFLKVQDGCDYFCSYCAVPYGRGHSRSLDFGKVISQAKLFVQNGYREIVLSGINLGLYFDTEADKNLAQLITLISEIDDLQLIRLSSVEPQLWTDELLEQVADNPKLCAHFHLPLQSGSDSVLARMARQYRAVDVQRLIEQIQCLKPDSAIGLDVICGFPGETEEEAIQTYEFILSLPITYLHVFPFSPRKGTPAAAMPGQINGTIKRNRTKALLDLGEDKKLKFRQNLIRKQVKLRGIAEDIDENLYTALSDRFIRIYQKTNSQSGDNLLIGTPTKLCKDGVLLT